MDCKSKPFTQIDREYIITSKELKKTLGIQGDVISMSLHTGRSPEQEHLKVSVDIEKWSIQTREIKEK